MLGALWECSSIVHEQVYIGGFRFPIGDARRREQGDEPLPG